ncbi:hypothetical protein [Novosphingobium taihuense]|uniref:Uncharacterized protein n=1 Tax=Novosphingobium taihuense TaxID=260085 RepID=A0A7W7EWW9_9SPHN|nr:hypothetical protein [Novosphingobium taihuense]MBB4614750.1 hypothetical protein [Novosphingobium taihuense]TWH86008.1 hypothetical protein IQ25_01455 [Novosphingobium taihuense]
MHNAAAALRFAAALAVLLVTDGSVAKPARTRPSPPASSCADGERVVYSCRFGMKIGSICLGRNSLHYRFGRPGRPDITVSSSPDWSNIHTGGNRSQGGLNQDYIRFTNGKTHYVVHVDETGSLNENPGIASSGIEVLEGETGSATLASLRCKSAARFNAKAFFDLNRSAPAAWNGAEVPGGPFEMIY